MNHAASMIASPFDLDALDALLGPKAFAAAIDRNASTGLVRYAALNRDSTDNGTRVRVTASYALGFPGCGRRLYTLLTLDLKVQDGVATVLCARRLGRLVAIEPLAEALIALARPLSGGYFPNRVQLAPFLPPLLLDALERDLDPADFPPEGADNEERLPELLWDRPPVLHRSKIAPQITPKVDPWALAVTLNLAVGEKAQMADVDPATGDYRVFHIGVEPTLAGGQSLVFELHRQAPGLDRRLFDVWALVLAPAGSDGLCPIESYSCDAGSSLADFPRRLSELARIVAALQEKKRPQDAIVLPFLSKPAQFLWTHAVVPGGKA